MAAPVVATYNWTGFYIGGVVGYGWAKAQHCDYGPPDVCIPVTDPKGWNAGVTVGYNWQSANWQSAMSYHSLYGVPSVDTSAEML